MKIQKVLAQEILDSRGNPTVSATVLLQDGSIGWAAVPSGASTGKYEAVELRDSDLKRYSGQGVLKAVENINVKIAGTIIAMNAEDQEKIDQKMIEVDGTKNKANLGANAILAVSLAVARAEASSEKKPLYQYLSRFNPSHKEQFTMPIPQLNIMNGAKHANWLTDIQEYMILPIGAKSFADAMRMGVEVYHALRNELKALGYSVMIGDEGGYAPRVQSNEEPFERIVQAINKAEYIVGKDISIGIDCAASEYYKDEKYHLNKEGKTLSSDELLEFYKKLLARFPLVSLEDTFDQDDWQAWKKITAEKGNTVQIVGDDLLVTNIERIKIGVSEKAINAIIIKLNQIGTLSETISALLFAKQNKIMPIISHRSGETEDIFIADLAVAMDANQIKTGAPARGERTAKYNRLMMIEKELGEKATYAEFSFFNPGITTL
ncbi:MAG: Enolase [Candidatus Roizmanbacteria bacterium GW2011_GWA2_36_23]|uniref:Enolase n=1 Tax=Candidatus Roizmanbacteria bacterium GW2011_GWA2_36_23 TaxID=1618480 RepID=A0A0G0HCZ6_9BACT|nr:MAG: Enolase [Candidatus Roizmanbacteria bacterium GW2011_GWA2_36_23]